MNQAELYRTHSIGQHQVGLQLMDYLNIKSGNKILDIGSGTGNLTYELAKKIGLSGTVCALDPDTDRMKIAQANQPNNLTNIKWFNGNIENYTDEINSFDFAYSNYVFHWIPDQEQAINKVANLLKPGSHFGINVVLGHPEVIEDITDAIGLAGDKFRKSFYCRSKESWLKLFEQAGLTIKQLNTVPEYAFKDLDELMTWWQGTTHGMFAIDMLSQEQINSLKLKHPGRIEIYSAQTLSCVLEKI